MTYTSGPSVTMRQFNDMNYSLLHPVSDMFDWLWVNKLIFKARYLRRLHRKPKVLSLLPSSSVTWSVLFDWQWAVHHLTTCIVAFHFTTLKPPQDFAMR